MGLLRTLLHRGISIFAMVIVTLLLICTAAGASGLEEQILTGKINYMRGGYSQSLHTQAQAGEINATEIPDLIDQWYQDNVERLGLDKPWWNRLLQTFIMVVTLDLGETGTLMSGSVGETILEAIPNTLLLIVASMGVSAPLGVLLGASTVRKAKTQRDLVTSLISVTSFSLPGWLLGYLLLAVFLRLWFSDIYYFAGFAASGGAQSVGGLDLIFSFIYHWGLPIISLSIPSLGFWCYQTRSILVKIAQEEYVTVAEAKGLSQGQINRRYILRVGLPTVLTQVVMVLHSTISNSVPVEVVFGWHGLGTLLWRVAWSGNIETYGSAALLLGVVYAYSLVYATLRFALEVLYVVLDPRIRY